MKFKGSFSKRGIISKTEWHIPTAFGARIFTRKFVGTIQSKIRAPAIDKRMGTVLFDVINRHARSGMLSRSIEIAVEVLCCPSCKMGLEPQIVFR